MRSAGTKWTLCVVGCLAMGVGCIDQHDTDDNGWEGFALEGDGGGEESSSSGQGGAEASSSSSSGSSTGGAPPVFDTCPGEAIGVEPGTNVSIPGSTVGLAADDVSFCMSEPSPDAVYQLDLPSACTLSIDLIDAAPLDGVLSVRRGSCSTELAGAQCTDMSDDDETFRQHVEPGSLWVWVHGADGSAGDYTLDIECEAPVCGDGVLNPGEQCDHGGASPLDGCGDPGAENECQVEAADAADTCEGLAAPFSIPVGVTWLPATDPVFNNSEATDDYKGPCAPAGELDGKDEVFAFTAEASGTLDITVGSDRDGMPYCQSWMETECWYRFVYVREADCNSGPVLECNELSFVNGLNELSIPVTEGQTYYVFVDGLNGEFYSMGPYLVRLELQTDAD